MLFCLVQAVMADAAVNRSLLILLILSKIASYCLGTLSSVVSENIHRYADQHFKPNWAQRVEKIRLSSNGKGAAFVYLPHEVILMKQALSKKEQIRLFSQFAPFITADGRLTDQSLCAEDSCVLFTSTMTDRKDEYIQNLGSMLFLETAEQLANIQQVNPGYIDQNLKFNLLKKAPSFPAVHGVWYNENGYLRIHRDKTWNLGNKTSQTEWVLSISLGANARFTYHHPNDREGKQSIFVLVESGDVLLFNGAYLHHGVQVLENSIPKWWGEELGNLQGRLNLQYRVLTGTAQATKDSKETKQPQADKNKQTPRPKGICSDLEGGKPPSINRDNRWLMAVEDKPGTDPDSPHRMEDKPCTDPVNPYLMRVEDKPSTDPVNPYRMRVEDKADVGPVNPYLMRVEDKPSTDPVNPYLMRVEDKPSTDPVNPYLMRVEDKPSTDPVNPYLMRVEDKPSTDPVNPYLMRVEDKPSTDPVNPYLMRVEEKADVGPVNPYRMRVEDKANVGPFNPCLMRVEDKPSTDPVNPYLMRVEDKPSTDPVNPYLIRVEDKADVGPVNPYRMRVEDKADVGPVNPYLMRVEDKPFTDPDNSWLMGVEDKPCTDPVNPYLMRVEDKADVGPVNPYRMRVEDKADVGPVNPYRMRVEDKADVGPGNPYLMRVEDKPSTGPVNPYLMRVEDKADVDPGNPYLMRVEDKPSTGPVNPYLMRVEDKADVDPGNPYLMRVEDKPSTDPVNPYLMRVEDKPCTDPDNSWLMRVEDKPCTDPVNPYLMRVENKADVGPVNPYRMRVEDKVDAGPVNPYLMRVEDKPCTDPVYPFLMRVEDKPCTDPVNPYLMRVEDKPDIGPFNPYLMRVEDKPSTGPVNPYLMRVEDKADVDPGNPYLMRVEDKPSTGPVNPYLMRVEDKADVDPGNPYLMRVEDKPCTDPDNSWLMRVEDKPCTDPVNPYLMRVENKADVGPVNPYRMRVEDKADVGPVNPYLMRVEDKPCTDPVYPFLMRVEDKPCTDPVNPYLMRVEDKPDIGPFNPYLMRVEDKPRTNPDNPYLMRVEDKPSTDPDNRWPMRVGDKLPLAENLPAKRAKVWAKEKAVCEILFVNHSVLANASSGIRKPETVAWLPLIHESDQELKGNPGFLNGFERGLYLGFTKTLFRKFWCFNHTINNDHQIRTILALGGDANTRHVKKDFYEKLKLIQGLNIPVHGKKIVLSFQDSDVVESMYKSGLLVNPKDFILNGHHIFSKKEQKKITEKTTKALHFIQQADNVLYESLLQVVACIGYYKAAEKGHLGGTVSSAVGLIWLDPSKGGDWSIPFLAEQIVHEYVHTTLFIAEMVRGMYTDASLVPTSLVVSAIRRQKRGYDKSFHAAYVATGLVAFHAETGSIGRAAELAKYLNQSVHDLEKVQLETGILDNTGSQMLAHLKKFLHKARLM